MKQKIIKAINEGIRKSLLQFDDVEFDKSTNTNQKVSKSLKDWKWIQDNFVDLGLPSGTLWCKYNLGATCEKNINTWYGNYYMWGSTVKDGDEFCGWYHAPFNNNVADFPNRHYFNAHRQEFMTGDILDLNHDIAYRTDKRMEMPTMKNITELLKYTTNEWVEDYGGISSLNGRIFTGNNRNSIFIPASDEQRGYVKNIDHTGDVGYIWSKSLDTDDISSAMALEFYCDVVDMGSFARSIGFPIRPICNI